MKPEEYHRLLEITTSLREKVAYALFYTAGLRLYEAFNLTWDCLVFDKNILLVTNREATAHIPPSHIKDHEARRIPLPAHTIALLTQRQAEAPDCPVDSATLRASQGEMEKGSQGRFTLEEQVCYQQRPAELQETYQTGGYKTCRKTNRTQTQKVLWTELGRLPADERGQRIDGP